MDPDLTEACLCLPDVGIKGICHRAQFTPQIYLLLIVSSLLSLPIPVLSSSTISLNKLLDAGLYTGEVTEIAGGPGSGKTQVPLGPAAGRVGGRGCIGLDSLGSSCGCPCGLQGQNRPDGH